MFTASMILVYYDQSRTRTRGNSEPWVGHVTSKFADIHYGSLSWH